MARLPQFQGYEVTLYSGRYRLTGNIPESQGRDFTLGERSQHRWQTSLLNSGKRYAPRHEFRANTFQSAASIAESYWYEETVSGPTIHEMFAHMLAYSNASQTTIDKDYLVRAERFRDWANDQGLVYWSELTPKHLSQYALHDSDLAAYTIRNNLRVVTMTARHAQLHFPEFSRPLAVKIPKLGSDRERDTLTLAQSLQLLDKARARKRFPFKILPGLALCALASLRTQEMRKARWDDYDAERGVLTVHGKIGSREIPLCRDLIEILEQTPKDEEFIVETRDVFSYRQAFYRLAKPLFPELNVEPYGLRRTLVQAFFDEDLYGIDLQLYRGHKPESISKVDWTHYLLKQSMRPEKMIQRLRKSVVEPLERMIDTCKCAKNVRTAHQYQDDIRCVSSTESAS